MMVEAEVLVEVLVAGVMVVGAVFFVAQEVIRS